MKKQVSILTAACLLLVSTSIFSQSTVCENGYMAFKEGIRMELTHYDSKGRPNSITKQTVKEVDGLDDGFKATIEMESSDEKGKRSTTTSYDVTCKGNSIFIDMRSMLNPEATASTQEMEMEVTGDAMEFPNELTPGQTLPDGNIEMKASMNGIKLMTIKMNVTNRKVEGNESVTTPAGTFDCIKITQDTDVKAIFKMKAKTTTWYAIGVGMVKTENYDKNGKVESSTVLTKFEK